MARAPPPLPHNLSTIILFHHKSFSHGSPTKDDPLCADNFVLVRIDPAGTGESLLWERVPILWCVHSWTELRVVSVIVLLCHGT